MKFLITIPCLFGAEHTEECIKSVVYQKDTDLYLIDNGAEQSVKDVINKYAFKHNPVLSNVLVKCNPQNVYVNPAWQQGIDFFLKNKEYTHLIIMNSDLIMQKDCMEILENRLTQNPDEIPIPIMTQDKLAMTRDINKGIAEALEVNGGTPGVFIVLSRKHVEIISPLPTYCLIWFGDNHIYDTLRQLGYKTVIPENLLSYHYWSQNVQKVQGISELIEKDKVLWEERGRKEMMALIEKHKNNDNRTN